MEQKLNRSKIKDILVKINELVEIFAKKFQLQDFIYIKTEVIYADEKSKQISFVDIKKIDFQDLLSHRNNVNYPEVEEFIKKVSDLVSNTEKVMLFIKRFYPEYEIILNTIEMLFFETPRKLEQKDLELLNKLYKKYTKSESSQVRNTN